MIGKKVKLEVIESDSNYVATIVKLPELKKVIASISWIELKCVKSFADQLLQSALQNLKR